MRRIAITLSSLITSIVLLAMGNAFLTTLLGLRLSIEAFNLSLIGWILVCYSVGFVAGSLHAEKIIRRVGHIRAFAVFAAVLAVVILLHPLAVTTIFWAVLRAVAGFAMAGLMIVIESWFSNSATNKNRGSLFAIYQVIFFLSTAGGQLLIRAADPADFVPFSLAAILVTLAVVPLSLTGRRSPTIEHTERMSLKHLYRVSPAGTIGALVGGLLISGFYNLGPVFANEVGLSVKQVSTFMASAVIAAMLLAWPVGRLCDRLDRYQVMLYAAVIAASASLVAAFIGNASPHLLLLFVCIYMGISAALYPISVAITNDLIDSHQITTAATALLLSYGIGSCIGPIFGSLFMDVLGPSGLFVSNALVLGAMIAFIVFGKSPTHSPVEQQETYFPTTPEATLGLAELDPRNPDFEEQKLNNNGPSQNNEPSASSK